MINVKYQSGTSFCIEISDSTSRTCMTVADAVRLKEELTKAIDDAEKNKKEELTEFEKELERFYNHHLQVCTYDNQGTVEDSLHDGASKLLSLARKQLIKDGYVIEKKAFHDAVEKIDDKNKAEMSIQYSLHCNVEDGTRHAVINWKEFQKLAQKFIDIGKNEALKDLPRWKKCADGPKPKPSNEWIFSIDSKNVTRESAIVHNGYFLPLFGLEKLPGFND